MKFLPLSHEQLANLANNLATCLAAGIHLPHAYRTTTRSLAKSDSESWDAVAHKLDGGESLADALREVEHRLPPFFIPTIAAGEHTGRLDESLRQLAQHCRMLAKPIQAMRNAWLIPLCIYLAAIPLKFFLLLFIGSWRSLVGVIWEAIGTIGSLAAIAVIVWAPPLKPAWDRLRLFIPIWGSAERDLDVSRFLRTFAMLYGCGGMRVEHMIRFACRSLSNDYLRYEISRAIRQIERGEDLAHSFAVCTCFTANELQTLAAGELTGTVEKSCDRLANELDESLETRMKVVTAIAARITMFLVVFSLVVLLASALPAMMAR